MGSNLEIESKRHARNRRLLLKIRQRGIMTSGTNNKRTVFGLPYNVGIGFLCVLGAVVLYAFYSNVLAGPPGVSAPPDAGKSTGAPAVAMPGSLPGAEAPQRRPASTQRRNNEEFNPPLHTKRPEDRIDTTSKVDPTLRLDLLAKVQAVELAGGTRNLFQFGAAPKPAELLTGKEPIVKPIGPVRPPDKVEPQAPPPAPAPPIALKFYGFSTVVRNGKKTAYFFDGDDIVIAAEGEMVKRRYRVIRILAATVQVEDTEGKRTVTIPITEEGQN